MKIISENFLNCRNFYCLKWLNFAACINKKVIKSFQKHLFLPFSHFMVQSWVFGSFLCKTYYFITSLSYTASIFILVVICMERYLAIQHPITSKQILTSSRLKVSTNFNLFLKFYLLCNPIHVNYEIHDC